MSVRAMESAERKDNLTPDPLPWKGRRRQTPQARGCAFCENEWLSLALSH